MSLQTSVLILDEPRIVIFHSTHSVFAKKVNTKQTKKQQTFFQGNTLFRPTQKLVDFFFVRSLCFPVSFYIEFEGVVLVIICFTPLVSFIVFYTEAETFFHASAASICGFIIQIKIRVRSPILSKMLSSI